MGIFSERVPKGKGEGGIILRTSPQRGNHFKNITPKGGNFQNISFKGGQYFKNVCPKGELC